MDDSGPDDLGPADADAPKRYEKVVGERLRAIRRQMGMSLHDVERTSSLEFKASVLGAYERGERAISVLRLQRLSKFYRVPVDQLLPDSQGLTPSISSETGGQCAQLDLNRLGTLGSIEAEVLTRFVKMIQVQRQDFNGRVLTIRTDDLRAVAAILDVSVDDVREKLR